jgi:hypothetical protein
MHMVESAGWNAIPIVNDKSHEAHRAAILEGVADKQIEKGFRLRRSAKRPSVARRTLDFTHRVLLQQP